MINVDFFQFTQFSLFAFLIAAVAVLRERTVLPFLIVVLGSILKGDFCAALVAALVVLMRFDSNASGWLRLKDSVSMFCLTVGTAVNSPYREFALCLGIIGISFQNDEDPLCIVPGLLLMHLYFDQMLYPEIVFGTAAFYVVLKEGLILGRVEQRRRILRWLEIPILVAILLPLQTFFQVWVEDQALLVFGSSIAFLVMAIALWIQLKKPDFYAIYSSIRDGGLNFIEKPASLFSGKQKWIMDQDSETKFSLESSFNAYFWPAALFGALWLILAFLAKGGIE